MSRTPSLAALVAALSGDALTSLALAGVYGCSVNDHPLSTVSAAGEAIGCGVAPSPCSNHPSREAPTMSSPSLVHRTTRARHTMSTACLDQHRHCSSDGIP
jgi:hypothetical protein